MVYFYTFDSHIRTHARTHARTHTHKQTNRQTDNASVDYQLRYCTEQQTTLTCRTHPVEVVVIAAGSSIVISLSRPSSTHITPLSTWRSRRPVDSGTNAVVDACCLTRAYVIGGSYNLTVVDVCVGMQWPCVNTSCSVNIDIRSTTALRG